MLRSLLLALIAIVASSATHAQTWPTKPIRVIVPFGAGSAVDVIPRIVFDQLSQQLGQPIIVENRVGAGGTAGMAVVAKAEPDGYTLLANSSAHTSTLLSKYGALGSSLWRFASWAAWTNPKPVTSPAS